MVNVTIFTASDTRYFPLAEGMINSVIRVLDKLPSKYNIEIKLLDIGLRQYEKMELNPSVEIIDCKNFDLNEFYFKLDKTKLTSNQFSFLARPFLPYFAPNSNIIIWLDADSWIQNEQGLINLIWAGELGKPAAVPEIDRNIAYNQHHREVTKGWSQGNYAKFFGELPAIVFSSWPMLNNGVFSVPTNHVFWSHWQSSARFALIRNGYLPDFGIDQIAFNYAMYQGKIQFHALPFINNFCSTHAFPVLFKNKLCAPSIPFEEILIFHLLDDHKWKRLGIFRLDDEGNEISGTSMHLDFPTISSLWKEEE